MGNPFVTVVCPALGNVLGVAMLMSPTPAVLGVRKSGTLGVSATAALLSPSLQLSPLREGAGGRMCVLKGASRT